MTTLPLPALVGLDQAVQALLLLAVEPRLRGAIFAAPVGTGKSSLARGFHALLEPGGLALNQAQQVPFVELPLGADEESLLGGLDLEATLRSGRRVARAGLLARAHGGLLYADQLNLHADATTNLLLGALDSGAVTLEREGLSLRAPAHFCLLGSYDPAEGAPRRHLLDRVGLLVTLPPAADAATRAEVVRRNSPPSAEPIWNEELDMLRALVWHAREQLAGIHIDTDQIEQIAAAALAFGVEGHRADGFAVYAACASAALGLRDAVDQADLELALRLVILPRATRIPTAEPPPPEQAPPPPPPPPEQPEQDGEDNQPPEPGPQSLPEEQVLAALAAELPPELEQLPFRALRRGRSGSRGSTSGVRGRHIRSVPGDPRRARIDIAATLRAAAPWQPLRSEQPSAATQRSSNLAAKFLVRGARRPLRLRADDLRIKQFRSKAGTLFCFAVDASGSMALHRMRQAKGAVHALLQQAYVHRDRVALLAFRGSQADLLLPPSQSVELARRALDLLPTGGGTPLAAALLAALEVARQARARGILQTVLVLLTDGRANVGLRAGRAEVEQELRALGHSVAAAGIRSLVIDTQRSYLSRGEARHLAEWLGGQYIYLPNAKGQQIAAVASEEARD